MYNINNLDKEYERGQCPPLRTFSDPLNICIMYNK